MTKRILLLVAAVCAFAALAMGPAGAQSTPDPIPPTATTAAPPSGGGGSDEGAIGRTPDDRDGRLAFSGSEALQLSAIGLILVGLGVVAVRVRNETDAARTTGRR